MHMTTEDLSHFVKNIMKTKGLSLQKVADTIPISKQGLHNWLQKRNSVDWKIQSLLNLSKVLKFDLLISNGKLYVKENEEMENESNLKTLKGRFKTILLDNGEKVSYKIYKEFKEYSIVNLYAPNSNLNDDIKPSLLEDSIYFNSKEECLAEYPDCMPIDIYTLVSNSTGYIKWPSIISIYPYDIETRYYLHLVPVLEITDDGFEVVMIDENVGLKIAKAYVCGSIVGGEFFISDTYSTQQEDSLPGLINIICTDSDFEELGNWRESIRDIYEELDLNTVEYKHFDRNRRLINQHDTLVMTGYSYYVTASEYDELIYDDTFIDDFEIGDSIEVLKRGNQLGFWRNKCFYSLDSLKLLKWEIS